MFDRQGRVQRRHFPHWPLEVIKNPINAGWSGPAFYRSLYFYVQFRASIRFPRRGQQLVLGLHANWPRNKNNTIIGAQIQTQARFLRPTD